MTIEWEFAGRIVWCVCLVLWAAIRWTPNRQARKTKISFTSRSVIERFSMAISITGLGIIPGIWVFSGFPGKFDYPVIPGIIIAGALVFALSLWLFRKTHKALGKMWSHSLDLREGHKLVTRGVYKRVRHPMYSAFWLWAVAQPFLISNWFAGFAGILGFGTLFFLRIGQEEAMMRQQFGSEYDDYVAQTKRIIPGIY